MGARLNWRKAEKPRLWQVGNFAITQTIIIDALTPFQEFFATQMAAPSTFLPDTDPDQRMLNTSIRRVEIGGLVWSCTFVVNEWDTNGSSPDKQFYLQSLLTINSLDQDGNAIGIDYPWGTNTPPVINQPGTLTENRDEPTRILDRWGQAYGQHLSSVPAGVARSIPLTFGSRSRNLRLRLPVQEDQSLNFTFHVRHGGGIIDPDRVILSAELAGTIYYRYRL